MKRRHILEAVIVLLMLVLLGGVGKFLGPRRPAPVPGAFVNPVAPAATPANPTAPASLLSRLPAEAAATTNKIFLTANFLWQRPIAEEAFARFHDWVERYRAAAASEKSPLEAEGITLALARREALASLIRTDPERALELTVPIGVRRELPGSVVSLLEERVSGRGTLAVLGALPEPGKENEVVPTFRTASIDGSEFKAFVYGRRLGEPTRAEIPLNGIAVDNWFAVNENPVRVLEPEEAAEAKAQNTEAICAVSGQSANLINQEVVADVGGQTMFLCRPDHVVDLNDRIVAAESGPPSPEGAGPEASTWTEGQKKVIVIRVDFPDLTGLSLTESGGATMVSNLHNFYNEMSYGRAGFAPVGSGSDVTPIFRMTNSASWYGTNDYYNPLRAEARAAATAAGYVLGNYDRDVICMGSVPGFGWAGLAYVGSGGAWLRNSFGTGVAGHELGHNWGLNHANYWDTTGASVIGPGTSVEYGDSFDTMGSTSSVNNHFNARYKNYLNWLTTNEVVTATSNGTYRIYAHDNVNSFGIRGLRVVKNSSTNYWVEFRQKFTSNKWLTSGGGLRWAQNGNQKSQLLDTTPGSTDGKTDSAIVIGRTFSDTDSGIHITPIGKGGTSPESLDVVVNLGAFPANLPPTVDFSASATNAGTGVTVNFAATALDPNGDDLAYYWDFGDGNFGTNSPTVGKSWSSAGEYQVRCVASDMKGGVASQSLIVTIGSPTTFRISGLILGTNGPLQGARVYVSTTRMSYTDSDGTYDIVGLPGGTYTVNASLQNYTFTASGVTNPVSVGPNRTGIDFLANYSTLTTPTITSQPVSQAVNPGANVTFSVGATGSTPLYYQWRFNGANLSGATGSSYTKSNVQATNAGNYSVVVSNLAGTATSANAVLTVNTPPSITLQPQSQILIAGSTGTFTVAASGSAPLVYQWRRSGTNLAGATTSSYTRVNVQPADAGNYTVVVTNSLGSVTSAPAVLVVNYALYASATAGGTVTKSPDQTGYAPGSVVTLTATSASSFPFGGWSGDASGSDDPLLVTMTTNLTIVASFISPVADLIVDNPQASFTGNWTTGTAVSDEYGADYRIVASSANTASATASFRPNILSSGRYDVYAWWPTISKGAAVPFLVSSSDGNVTMNLNQSSGSGGWQLVVAGKMFSSGTNGFVRLANNVGQGGKNVAADAVRWVYSASQSAAPPTIATQPTNQTVVLGSSAAFYVGVVGELPITCQWRRNGSNIAGSTNGVLALNSVQTGDTGDYSVVAANSGGSITSVVATLTLIVPPAFMLQPTNQTVVEGNDTTFAIIATGTGPLTYQWFWNGDSLLDATNASLDLLDVQTMQAGDYYVTAANAGGVATSAVATLTVLVPPQILNSPQSMRVIEGSPVGFNVSAAGSAPLTYQWRFDGQPISNANQTAFSVMNVLSSDAGDYDVTVSNSVGFVTSVPATLVVSVRPVLGSVLRSNGIPQVTLSGTPGDSYAVEASTNQMDWTQATTVTNLAGTVQFVDEAAPSNNVRFYRARLIP